ncbi:MAG: DUF6427 family protein [Ferruginibacter sp.]
MTGTFKANNPYNNFLLFVYGFVLKLPIFLNPVKPHIQPLDGTLYNGFIFYLSGIADGVPVLYSIVTYVLIFFQAIAFNKMVNVQRMHPKPNYLTAMSYLLITSLFTEWYSLSAPLIVNSFLIWVWSRLCTLHNEPNPKTTIFNIGLFIGISSFFYFPSIAFALLIMVGLTIARPFRLAEWLMGLVGLVTPFYLFASWLFLTDKWKTYHVPGLVIKVPAFVETNLAYLSIILICITLVIGIFFINNNLRRQVVHTRKAWQLLLLYLVVAGLVPFLNATHSFSYFILIAVPLSFITASAFLYPEKKWFPVAMHWIMVGVCIAIGYFIR